MKHRPPSRFLLLLLLLGLSLAGGCAKKRPNILVITFDTTRADYMDYATGGSGRTPVLDELAKRGTWFSTAITSQPLTVPSHTTIMTGQYPYRHGVRNNGTYIVPAEAVTLAERLKGEGYATHAIVSAFVLDSQFGLDQGFDDYDDDLSGGPKQQLFMFKEVPAETTSQKAVTWLKEKQPADQPFFLWLHFFDPHADYRPPDGFRNRFPGDPYSAEIAYADVELGRVLTELEEQGLMEDTLVVFTSDHGEGLGDHGERTHGIFIYESTTRVPLIMAGPGVPKGSRVDSVARTADIVPTILDMLDLPSAGDLDGRSLVPFWKGDEEDERIAYMECFSPRLNFGWSELRGMRSARAKVIAAPRPETYDLESDPKELRNLRLSDQWPGDSRPMVVRLSEIANEDPFERVTEQQSEMDLETRQKLAALGYVWGTTGADPGTERPDPKDRIEYWERFQVAQGMIRAERYEEAVALIEALLEVDPNNVVAMGSLANALTKSDHADKALVVYQRMIEIEPARDSPYLGSARILMSQQRYSEAEALIRKILDLQPRNPDGYTTMGNLLIDQEQFDGAEPWFRKALAIDPNSTLAVAGLGNCLNRAGRAREALDILQARWEHDKTSHVIAYNLGVVADRLGNAKGALEYYQAAARIEPDHSMTWNNVASILHKSGKRQQALRFFEKAHDLDPENTEATYNLGTVLLESGRPRDALPLLEEAAAKRPDLTQARVMMAMALVRVGQKEKAIEVWKTLIDSAPAAWLNIAKLELDLGHRERARLAVRRGVDQHGERFQKALERNPELAELAR